MEPPLAWGFGWGGDLRREAWTLKGKKASVKAGDVRGGVVALRTRKE